MPTPLTPAGFIAIGSDDRIHGIGRTIDAARYDASEYGAHNTDGLSFRAATEDLLGLAESYGGDVKFRLVNGIACSLDEAIAIDAEV